MLKYYKIEEDVSGPEFATSDSACFDVRAYLAPGNTIYAGQTPKVVVYGMDNKKEERDVKCWAQPKSQFCCGFELFPGERALVPTGLIFDIPVSYSVRLHMRSSISLKKGLTMPNGEGIIDSDYYHQTYVMVYNASADTVRIWHGDRIAQGELVRNESYDIIETDVMPEQKTERVGGFGSTGN